ncbi:peroxisomal coenzyme A diphosphatase NUDT7-like isoform X2 [Glandiceps talaboti]
MTSKKEVIKKLKKFDKSNFVSAGEKVVSSEESAVLVPLFFKDDVLHVLLTVRSARLKTFSGHVAFPGGKKDKSDKSLMDAALREYWEEIGLPKEKVHVISESIQVMLMSAPNLAVSQFIAFIDDDFIPNVNQNEVDDVFSMPLEIFLSSEAHYSKEVFYGTQHIDLDSTFVHFFTYKENEKTYLPFGFTAIVCILLATVVFDKPPEFQFVDLPYHNNDAQRVLIDAYGNLSAGNSSITYHDSKL